MPKFTVTMISSSNWVGTEMESENWFNREFDSEEEALKAISEMTPDQNAEAWQAAVEDQGVEHRFVVVESDAK